jgi:CheY-like chemotaxis protein
MQISDISSGVIASLSSRLDLVKAEVSKNGRFEERTYKKFGLTIRRRMPLPVDPEPVAGQPAESTSLAAPDLPEIQHLPLVNHQNGSPYSNGNGHYSTGLANLALSLGAEGDSAIAGDIGRDNPAVAVTTPATEPASPEPHQEALSANAPSTEPDAPVPAAQQHPILSGKSLGVIGFSPADAAAIGQALAAQYCSFSFLSLADAEFRKGSTNGCDLLIVSVPPEWSGPGTLNPASLLKTKKPLMMVGARGILTALATRCQGGLRELVPAPWEVGDMIWRAATLLGRVQEPRGRTGKKNQRKRIIIGDESAARALLHAVLAQEGMECHVADNGVDTVALARSKQADAVIVDVSLPGLDGFQTLAEIRRDPGLKNIAVILLTARQSEADVLRGFGLGADDYVTKPFSPMEVAARVKRCLSK